MFLSNSSCALQHAFCLHLSTGCPSYKAAPVATPPPFIMRLMLKIALTLISLWLSSISSLSILAICSYNSIELALSPM